MTCAGRGMAPAATGGHLMGDERSEVTRGGLVVDPGDPATIRSARSFGIAATVYHRSRPGYPTAAIEWLIGDASRVLDLGAGTGKLTEALVELDRDVVAVDPIEEMLDEL